MTTVIDNRTQQIVSDSLAVARMLNSAAIRRHEYELAMSELLDPRNAPQPGGPWVELPIDWRLFNMTCSRERVIGGVTTQEQRNWIDGKNQTGG